MTSGGSYENGFRDAELKYLKERFDELKLDMGKKFDGLNNKVCGAIAEVKNDVGILGTTVGEIQTTLTKHCEQEIGSKNKVKSIWTAVRNILLIATIPGTIVGIILGLIAVIKVFKH